MFEIKFQHCKVLVWPTQHHMVTIFEDGTEVPACPNPQDPDSVKLARDLGYGDDLWAMTYDHEICHTVLAELEGKKVSPALWAAAHPKEPRNHDAFNLEEDRVFQLQRFLRRYIKYNGPLLPDGKVRQY